MTDHAPGYDLLSTELADYVELAPITEGRVRVGRVYDGPALRVRTLAIPAGVTLREHVAGAPVLIHVVAGRVRFEIGGEFHELAAGALVRADPQEKHEVYAHEDARLVLTFHPEP
ncbi:cupin domain-containing protein [Leucobacter albus]|uniref:Cupin domain-containing protein n=1 Tax=Leucobacter albus TaxID=272210 RepID=A0ABW3TV35_9MICO